MQFAEINNEVWLGLGRSFWRRAVLSFSFRSSVLKRHGAGHLLFFLLHEKEAACAHTWAEQCNFSIKLPVSSKWFLSAEKFQAVCWGRSFTIMSHASPGERKAGTIYAWRWFRGHRICTCRKWAAESRNHNTISSPARSPGLAASLLSISKDKI